MSRSVKLICGSPSTFVTNHLFILTLAVDGRLGSEPGCPSLRTFDQIGGLCQASRQPETKGYKCAPLNQGKIFAKHGLLRMLTIWSNYLSQLSTSQGFPCSVHLNASLDWKTCRHSCTPRMIGKVDCARRKQCCRLRRLQ